MRGLRSDHLNELGSILLNDFKGVFSCDDFNNLELKNHQKFICNMSSSKKIGTHWISIYIKDSCAYYFDSYGKNTFKDKNIINNLKRSKKKIRFLKQQIQSHDSLFCGYYAIAFLILSQQHQDPLRQIEQCFSKTNLLLNEEISRKMIKKALKESYLT